MFFKENGFIGKFVIGILMIGLVVGVNASDMFAAISVPGKSLSFNVPVKDQMNDLNDCFSFIKSRSSIDDNKNGYGIINYSHSRSNIRIENMWYLNEKSAYYNNGTSKWHETFDSAINEIILSCSDNISSIVMAAANNQGSSLNSHPARFDYNGKTYSLILNGNPGVYPGPSINRSYEFSFFKDHELTDKDGVTKYKWFERYPSVWKDVDPYSPEFDYKDFPTGEITLNVIMYYLITKNLELDSALYYALTDESFGEGFEHVYNNKTYYSLNLKEHSENENYAFTAIVSDGEKVYAFKSWKKNPKNALYCQDYQIGYIQNNDFTAITSIGEAGNYPAFQEAGIELLGQYDLAVFDPNKKFDPSSDIVHNFLGFLPEGTKGDKSVSEVVSLKPITVQEITEKPIANEILSLNKLANGNSEYSQEYKESFVSDGDESTAWASAPGARNEWIYIDLGDEKLTVNEVSIKWAGKYFAKKFRLYGHDGNSNYGDPTTWIKLTEEPVKNYNTVNGVYTLSDINKELRYVGVWLYDLNDIAFGIKEMEVMGHKSVVDFPDVNLRNKVLAAIGKTELPIYKDELLGLKSLNVDGVVVEQWKGIKECKNLEYLSAKFCKLTTFPSLDGMESMKVVDVSFNDLSSIGGFNSASNLEKLSIRRNAIKEIRSEDVDNLINLRELDISENEIQKVIGVYDGIDGVVALESLEFINMSGNPLLNDISVLNNLLGIKTIIASGCQVSENTQFNNLENLEHLDISNNKLAVCPMLFYNQNLKYLNLENNGIVRLDGALDSRNLKLRYVYLNNNKVESIDILSTLPEIRVLNLSGNKVSNISLLSSVTSLNFVDIEFNNMDVSEGSKNYDAIDALIKQGTSVYYATQAMN